MVGGWEAVSCSCLLQWPIVIAYCLLLLLIDIVETWQREGPELDLKKVLGTLDPTILQHFSF